VASVNLVKKLHEIRQFGQFIFGKIIKIVATKSHLLKLKCTKISVSARASPKTPHPIADFGGSYF